MKDLLKGKFDVNEFKEKFERMQPEIRNRLGLTWEDVLEWCAENAGDAGEVNAKEEWESRARDCVLIGVDNLVFFVENGTWDGDLEEVKQFVIRLEEGLA